MPTGGAPCELECSRAASSSFCPARCGVLGEPGQSLDFGQHAGPRVVATGGLVDAGAEGLGHAAADGFAKQRRSNPKRPPDLRTSSSRPAAASSPPAHRAENRRRAPSCSTALEHPFELLGREVGAEQCGQLRVRTKLGGERRSACARSAIPPGAARPDARAPRWRGTSSRSRVFSRTSPGALSARTSSTISSGSSGGSLEQPLDDRRRNVLGRQQQLRTSAPAAGAEALQARGDARCPRSLTESIAGRGESRARASRMRAERAPGLRRGWRARAHRG